MKIVLDTNVFISGIFWERNFCAQIIELWKKGKIILISSIQIIEELIKTLSNFKIPLSSEEILEWREIIIENSTVVESSENLEIVKEDPTDNKFLEAAIAGNADHIISQDRHLLNLKEFRGVKIVKPEEFLKIVFKN